MNPKTRIPLYVLVAGETFHTFPQFLPGLEELRKSDPDAHLTILRRGECYAAVWSLLVAIAVTYAVGTAVPLLIWAGTITTMYLLFEWHRMEDD